MTTIPALKVNNLTKGYKGVLALEGVSFDVKQGEIVGLLGPNGAGKSTTIQIILSLLTPDKGSVELFGKSLQEHREEVLNKMNFAAPYTPLPFNLTPAENLRLFSLYYGIKPDRKEIENTLKEFDLLRFKNEKTGGLSSGEQMRLGIAKAFVNSPQLLLLDEPTSSLDPAIAREMREKILKKTKEVGGSILWTSHNMREVERVADRIIFLSQGRIVADDTAQGLKAKFQEQDLEEIFVTIAKESLRQP